MSSCGFPKPAGRSEAPTPFTATDVRLSAAQPTVVAR